MKNYKAFKSGGQWFLESARGKLLAQVFDSVQEVVKYAKRYQLSVTF